MTGQWYVKVHAQRYEMRNLPISGGFLKAGLESVYRMRKDFIEISSFHCLIAHRFQCRGVNIFQPFEYLLCFGGIIFYFPVSPLSDKHLLILLY